VIGDSYAALCRDFVLSSYQELKKANRHFPILVREASNAEAAMTARYGEHSKAAAALNVVHVLCGTSNV